MCALEQTENFFFNRNKIQKNTEKKSRKKQKTLTDNFIQSKQNEREKTLDPTHNQSKNELKNIIYQLWFSVRKSTIEIYSPEETK